MTTPRWTNGDPTPTTDCIPAPLCRPRSMKRHHGLAPRRHAAVDGLAAALAAAHLWPRSRLAPATRSSNTPVGFIPAPLCRTRSSKTSVWPVTTRLATPKVAHLLSVSTRCRAQVTSLVCARRKAADRPGCRWFGARQSLALCANTPVLGLLADVGSPCTGNG